MKYMGSKRAMLQNGLCDLLDLSTYESQWGSDVFGMCQSLVDAAEDGAKNGVTFENTSETEPLVCLRYFGPEVNPEAPAMGAYRKNKF